jgi:hypothetical protein
MSISLNSPVVITSTWTSFITIIVSKSLSIQYNDDGIVYSIFALDGPITYFCNIYHGTVPDGVIAGGYSQAQNDADKVSFEANYKPNANEPINPIILANNAQLDAFSRLRVVQPQTLFDNKQLVDNQPLFFDDQQTSGSGTTSTYLTNQAATQMSVSNVTAGTRVRQTFSRFLYQPGKGSYIKLTGVLGTGVSGITRRIGYFDQNNGIFFQVSGPTTSIVVRSDTSGSPVDIVITQANWNLDRFDGTGPSGNILDTSKTQIFVMDFQWLGTGRIRFGLNIAGANVYVHEVLNANVNTIVWASSPNLPVRFEIANDGTGPAASMLHISSSVTAEGGIQDTGFVLSTDRGATGLTTHNDANIYPLIAIRLKSTYQMAVIDPLNLSIVCTSDTIYRYCLLINPTVTGTALSFSGITNSAVEAAITATNATTVSGGIQFFSGYIDATASQPALITNIPTYLRIGSNIAGVSDILVLGVQRITGTSETFLGGMSWREQI